MNGGIASVTLFWSLLGRRPTVGRMTLDHAIGVRIPASQSEGVWQTRLGTSVQGFPVTFSIDGKQYLVIPTPRRRQPAAGPFNNRRRYSPSGKRQRAVRFRPARQEVIRQRREGRRERDRPRIPARQEFGVCPPPGPPTHYHSGQLDNVFCRIRVPCCLVPHGSQTASSNQ